MKSFEMNSIAVVFLMAFTLAIPAQAATLIAEEDFEGGAADWVDESRNPPIFNATGGHDDGAYISVLDDIDTSSNGQFGGYVTFRCAVAPSQLPSQDCSNGMFVGNWYFTDGVQELRYWFRHNSTKPGGVQPTIRVAVTGNFIGGSAIFPAIPANTWTQLSVTIDAQDPLWDSNWGSLYPHAVNIFKNVGRLQPGIYDDPAEPDYSESNVSFDIDDVKILGSTPITAEIMQRGTWHPQHDGANGSVASIVTGLHDTLRVGVLGADTGSGDPANLNTDNIVKASIRVGPLGAASSGAANYGKNYDSDGLDDAQFRTLTGDTGAACDPGWNAPTDLAFRGELTTGEVISGIDASLNMDCDAVCHK